MHSISFEGENEKWDPDVYITDEGDRRIGIEVHDYENETALTLSRDEAQKLFDWLDDWLTENPKTPIDTWAGRVYLGRSDAAWTWMVLTEPDADGFVRVRHTHEGRMATDMKANTNTEFLDRVMERVR